MSTNEAQEATSPVTKRVVPGAPPTVEKAAKKKRKAKTKIDEEGKENASNAPPPSQAAEVPPSNSTELQTGGDDKKSTILELINKRIRNFTKKIQRVKEYQLKPASTLNEDQKRAVSSLPTLEGILHELDDTKKAIEPIEVQATRDLALQRLESENSAHARTQQAVTEAKAEAASKFNAVLKLITTDVSTLALGTQEQNALANFIAHITSSDSKAATISNLVNEEGDWEGYSYSQLLAFAHRVAPESTEPVEPTGEYAADESAPAPEQLVASEDTHVLAEVEADKPVGNAATAGNFHFMLESELEPQPPQPSDGAGLDTSTPVAEPTVNGDAPDQALAHVQHSMEDPIAPRSENLDWAADDATDLPPINTLEAKFGTSGEVTPEIQPEPRQTQADTPQKAAPPQHRKQQPQAQTAEVDGFIPIPSRRGGNDRGPRGGGERGGRGRGGFRGGRGGERGGRGRGGFRGGERGHRGGSRGGRQAPEATA